VLLELLALTDVRNYAELEFTPVRGLNLLIGDNAQGKSNLLEAMAMLGTGRSFRTTHDRDIIRADAGAATISGRARSRAGTLQLACSIARGPGNVRKRYTVNGGPVRYARYLGRAQVVTFAPRDLDVIVGPPSRRRAFLNAALSQERPAYYPALASYTRTVEQKRALLRAPEPVDSDLLAIYDERLVRSGAELMSGRRSYVAVLSSEAERAYAAWASDGPLEVRYAPNVDLGPEGDADPAEAFELRLRAARPLERSGRRVLAGPHRDDVTIRLAGRDLSIFGSQGQQRSAVLALKLAEYRVSAANAGESPLLLLDDVLSELDSLRQSAFLAGIADVEQAFVTATTAPPEIAAAATYRVVAAELNRIG